MKNLYKIILVLSTTFMVENSVPQEDGQRFYNLV
jgi:hypothetical protein